MLVLERRAGEGLIIGPDVRVVILGTKPNGAVRVGIEAPRSVNVRREELPPLEPAGAVPVQGRK